MSWRFRYRLRSFMRSSLWVAPLASMALALVIAPLTRALDDDLRFTLMGFGIEGSRAITGALASSLLSFIVFTMSMILLAIQLASGQLSPRIIERVLESRLVKATLSFFVFSFAYTLAVLGRIEDGTPQLPVLLAVLLNLLSIAVFLYLLQEVGRSLRPSVVLSRIGADTEAAIRAVFPEPVSVSSLPARKEFTPAPGQWTVKHEGPAGVFRAFDAEGLVEIARQSGCVVEIVPQIGDFLAPGTELLRMHCTSPDIMGMKDDLLRRCVATGRERVLDHDPAFGFRILVDIASKALSPAINDPTTGALVLDQIQLLLHLLSQRQHGAGVRRDSSGQVRLLYRTPGWEEFVTLAVTEIRIYGATNPQVTRRLQAMLHALLQVVPAERAGTLRKEMSLLKRTVETAFSDPEDQAIAQTADTQGFGGLGFN